MRTGVGTLFVVATPIGNLADLTIRARDVLAGVDLVLAEDTRHSRKLLDHYGIGTPMESLHEHNERERVEAVLAKLEAGADVALVSDAGTPLISDPGRLLVAAVARAGMAVSPIPGANAAVAALSVAGLAADRFHFEGFLASRDSARRRRLKELEPIAETLVFYEAPHRIGVVLADMAEILGARAAVVARELSKRFESVERDALDNLAAKFAAEPGINRGEMVIVVAGNDRPRETGFDARRLLEVLLEDLPAGRASAAVARLTGLSRRQAYQLALELKPESASSSDDV
jgi:16S rRNA (cytidine1402-2'-O)-methyltransferase